MNDRRRCIFSMFYHQRRRYLSSDARKALSKTVFLPRTAFVVYVKPTERAALDAHLQQIGDIDQIYQWQLHSPDRAQLPRFVLLDGPPYANGNAHVGHAVNKVLKDFALRHRMRTGHRVEYRPGWDCHGLPIEMQVEKAKNATLMSSIERRHAARQLANASIATQMSAFRRWSVIGDWNNIYRTMDADYESRQLRLFARMYEYGVIYRAFKPVYWSPSSRTALAESELEYVNDHKSTAVYFRFRLDNVPMTIALATNVYALIWTTTPWTLPFNDAICYANNGQYLLVKLIDNSLSDRDLYVISNDALADFQKQTNLNVDIVERFSGDVLANCHYRHCMRPDEMHPFLSGAHVSTKVGTGLVHTAYAHGFDDYKIAMQQKTAIDCFVDEDGRYQDNFGDTRLHMKSVLDDGQHEVLQLLQSDIVHRHQHVHSYPYDWRSKQPVIIRSSAQWFIDISSIANRGVRMIDEQIEMTSGDHDSDLRSALKTMISNWPAWCISRQRVWGVPIPVFYRVDGSPIMTQSLIHHIAELVQKYGTDCWWNLSDDELFPAEIRKLSNVSDNEKLTKGTDIMDVWFDSGTAWYSTTSDENESISSADLIVEGMDQYRGWFQSLLLTAVAADCPVAPFRRALVHGFCVDDQNKKMSKSIGNVIDPDMIINGSLNLAPLGVDGLRLWVAIYGSQNNIIRIGPTVLDDVRAKLIDIRKTLHYLLGCLNGYDGCSPPDRLYALDEYILSTMNREATRWHEYCTRFAFQSFIVELIKLSGEHLSSYYFAIIKDRLYCDARKSIGHRSAQFTIDQIGRIIASAIAPIMPHLAAEFYQHHPCVDNICEQLCQSIDPYHSSTYTNIDAIIDATRPIRNAIAGANTIDRLQCAVRIEVDDGMYQLLQQVQSDVISTTSQLVELCSADQVHLVHRSDSASPLTYQLYRCDLHYCNRCRKRNRHHANETLCQRCSHAVDEYDRHFKCSKGLG